MIVLAAGGRNLGAPHCLPDNALIPQEHQRQEDEEEEEDALDSEEY